MIPAKMNRRMLHWVLYVTVILMSAACSPVARWADHTVGGPNTAADATVVVAEADASRQSNKTVSQTVVPALLRVTVTDAIILSLENNRSLLVQRLTPSIQQTFEDQERSVFDPELGVTMSTSRIDAERLARSGSETEAYNTNQADGSIVLEQYFPSGTTLFLEADAEMEDSSLYDDRFYETRLGMTVSQALLRGYGTDANLARLRQARLDTRITEYELRGFTAFLVAEVEQTYWDYALAKRQIEIVQESLKVARQQLDETRELIEVGRLAKAELAAVQAEVAAQEQALIEARANKEAIRLRLLRLLNPVGANIWEIELDLVHQPKIPKIKLEAVEQHVAVARRMSPALNEARLRIKRGDLELVKTRNGLLPLMDLFITLGKSGYANAFGQSISSIDNGGYDTKVGLSFQYPFFNRNAKARHRRSQLDRDQSWAALENLSQIVEVDVRTAYIEVERTKQQIDASSVTRQFDEEKLRIETEKLRVGKSTSFLVAQAQRDLLVSRIAEVRALASYLQALADLYRQDGSLLERRRIQAPGGQPVILSQSAP
jgi:outer membrane protein TolC